MIKNKKKTFSWIIVLVVSTIVIMFVFARTNLYISEPFDIGFDLFIDIGAGVVFVFLISIGVIIGFFTFRKKTTNI